MNSELERKVEERTKALLHANRLAEVGSLAAGAAHEIKNPLAILQVYIENLEELELSQEVKGALAKMKHASGRIKVLADGLRSFAKPNEAKNFEVFSLHQTITQLLLLYEPIYQKKIRIKMLPELQAPKDKILGLPSHIEQILSNLFGNARDAIDETGRAQGQILITTRLISETHIELTVPMVSSLKGEGLRLEETGGSSTELIFKLARARFEVLFLAMTV